MNNQEESNSILRDFKKVLLKEQVFGHLKANKKKLIYSLVTIFTILLIWNAWDFYVTLQAKKYSTILHKAVIDEQDGNLEQSTKALEKISNSNSPAGVKQVAMLKYAAQLLNEGKEVQAAGIYLQVNKNQKFDPYFKEYAGLSALKILINQEDKKDQTRSLIVDLEKNSKILTYYITEQKGIFEWQNENFKLAKQIFEDLSKNPETSGGIKERAAKMIDIYNIKFAE
ncbi:MAG: hypothetical protein ACJAW3_000486 [Lentimonas sp.]|jgi:hypothetical protein